MTPITSESIQKSANQEGKILLAFDDIKNGRIKSHFVQQRSYTKFHAVPYKHLHVV
jgi:hypothetical protein